MLENDLNILVYNFVDILSHARTDIGVIRDLATDERAYRSLTRSWFIHSSLFELLKTLSAHRVKVIFSTDHGTIRVQNPIKIIGDRKTSANLRYKMGRSLDYNPSKVFEIKNPEKAWLPKSNISSRYIFATNKDFYAMLFTVFGRAFAPDEKNLPFYGALPVHYIGDSMIVNTTILKKWEENFIYNMIDTHIASLKSLNALKLDWGRNDEIPFISVTCMQLSKKLEEYGIDHFAEEYLGDHGSKIAGNDGRINTEMLPFFNNYLKFEDQVKIPTKKK